jgi:hypothetical protein
MNCLNQPTEEYEKVQAHFWGNLDETGIMGNDGNLHIVGSGHRKKTEKNTDDFRESITVV